jgi:hypothetical protein
MSGKFMPHPNTLVLELIAEASRSRRRQSEGKPPLWLRQAKDGIRLAICNSTKAFSPVTPPTNMAQLIVTRAGKEN